jgi:hypothetical protein
MNKDKLKSTIKFAIGLTIFLVVYGLLGAADFNNLYGGV